MMNQTVVDWMIIEALNYPGPFICEVEIDPSARVWPKCQYGNSIENQSPLLPPEELAENMRNE
jgi:thiamine pyrophosphate-dependent acetolactate synthase large subunit-like protein